MSQKTFPIAGSGISKRKPYNTHFGWFIFLAHGIVLQIVSPVILLWNLKKLFLDEDVAAFHAYIFELMSSPGLINKLRTPSTSLWSVEEHVIASASSTLDMLSLRPVRWERVRTATACDDDMHALVNIIDTKGLLQLFKTITINILPRILSAHTVSGDSIRLVSFFSVNVTIS